MTYYSSEKRMKSDTLVRKLIRSVQEEEAVAEDMRKLYVALTRPKEKLIVTGVVKPESVSQKGEVTGGIRQNVQRWQNMKQYSGRYDKYDICRKGAAFLDWIAPAAICAGGGCRSVDETPAPKGVWHVFGIPFDSVMQAEPAADEQTRQYDEGDMAFEQVKALLESCYHYEDAKDLPTKLSVSQVKRLFGQSEGENAADLQKNDKFSNDDFLYGEPLKKRPEFMNAKKITGAELGTAYHSVFAYINIRADMDCEYIKEEIGRITEEGILSMEEAAQIVPEKILAFFNSKLGRQMTRSVYFREAPFEISVPAQTFYHDNRREEILLQGIIDCYFETPDKQLILLDYKTDRCAYGQELAEKYRTQLFWYKQAAEKILSRNIDKVYIYSVYLEQEILIEF